VDIDVRRDVFPITGRLEDRDSRSYVGQVGPRLRELLFVVRDGGDDFRSLVTESRDGAYLCHGILSK
jgi:hypothetical protein